MEKINQSEHNSRGQKLTDEDLIRNFQNGDVTAFDEIVKRFRDPLYHYIYRIINDAVFAEDLLQETFLRLWEKKHSYREIAKFSTWIYTVAGNLAKSELRRLKIRRWFSLSGNGNDEERPIDVLDTSADVAKDFERGVIRKRVDEEIQALPLVFREVIVLRDVQELSYEDISSILDIPLGTVKSRVNRGRRRLQKKLQDLL